MVAFIAIILSVVMGVITAYLGGDGGIAVAVVWVLVYLWLTRHP